MLIPAARRPGNLCAICPGITPLSAKRSRVRSAADLDRRQGLAIEFNAVVEKLEPVGCQFACHFHDVFLLDGGGFIGQFARHPEVLGEYQQAAGIPLQRCMASAGKSVGGAGDAGTSSGERVSAQSHGFGIHVAAGGW